MKISVIIPAYNAGSTIEATLNAVLSQTESPYEILVCDDGSTDDTALIVDNYKPHVTMYRQSNHGVAPTLNYLCEKARGDIIAVLAADDIWHPRYLEVQRRLIEDYPNAVAYFTEHNNFYGYGNYHWNSESVDIVISAELIAPVSFIKRYNKKPMSFQWSCGCISKKVLTKIGREPFRISGAEDTYIHNLLPLLGPVLYTPLPLVAYRVTNTSLSTKLLRNSLLIIEAFNLLEKSYRESAEPMLHRQFRMAFASRMRQCGKFLMGAGMTPEARRQFWHSVNKSNDPRSMVKSLGLLFLTYMPVSLQPTWPLSNRM